MRTQQRYAVFAELKAKHPAWSQAKMAMEANLLLQTDSITADTVRNTYGLMHEKWERADRIR